MNVKAVLNADMTTTARWLREGFAWWTGELAEMLPRDWRKPLMRSAPAIAHWQEGTIVVRGSRDAEPAAAPKSAVLMLPSCAVLMREFDLPALPAADTRRMIALDIDRLAPFRMDVVAFDFEAVEAGDGQQRIALGVIPRADLEHAVAVAREQGVNPCAVSIEAEGGARFDFLRGLAGGGSGGSRRAYWWVAAGALAAANILVLISRDESDLQSLREAVEAQETTVAVVDRARRKVTGEAAVRRELMQAKQETPLRAIAALSKSLPNEAWVHRLEWTPKSVHIAGYQKGAPNLLRSLESSPALRNARVLTAAAAAVPGVQSFDIAADIERERAQ
jgi:hypothetical protein